MLVCLHTQERGIVSNKLIVKKDQVDKQDVQYLSFRALQSVFALHCCFYLLYIVNQVQALHEHFLEYLPGLKRVEKTKQIKM